MGNNGPLLLNLVLIVFVFIALGAGLWAGRLYERRKSEAREKEREAQAGTILQQAETQAKEILLKAKDDSLKLRDQAEEEVSRRVTDIGKEEQRMARRREELDRKIEQIDQRRSQLDKRQSTIDKRESDVSKKEAERQAELQRVAAMSRDEARGVLMAEVEKEARGDMARTIRRIEEEARADLRGRGEVAQQLQRGALPFARPVVEHRGGDLGVEVLQQHHLVVEQIEELRLAQHATVLSLDEWRRRPASGDD